MLTYPKIEAIAFSLGPLSVRWYGLMYLAAFLQFWILGRRQILTHPRWTHAGWSVEELDELLFYGVLGVVLGGRLGEVIFYQPAYFIEHPLEILAIWHGGMSFHGGFLGVLLAMIFCARKAKRRWFDVTDFIAPLVPLGLAAGRIGNFINGELRGRIADASLPWAMQFPSGDALPRHPSTLYQAALEGFLLFVLLWIYSGKTRPRGAISGAFLIGYGCFRAFAEFFREPDDGIFGRSEVISMGQWLSLPMVLFGVLLLMMAYRKPAA